MKNFKAHYKSLMHSNPAIQKEKARLRKQAGLSLDPEREKEFNRGKQRQEAHRLHQDLGNGLQVLTVRKKEWLTLKGKPGGKLTCKFHNGKLQLTAVDKAHPRQPGPDSEAELKVGQLIYRRNIVHEVNGVASSSKRLRLKPQGGVSSTPALKKTAHANFL